MQDPQLNKSLEETKELQTRWNQFREFVRMAIERGKVSPEAEMKFLELKSYIAILHDGFMAKLTHDQKVGQAIMSIVGDCIMLARIANYNDAEKQKFEFDWNECYLLISEQTQGLMDEKERLAGISERAYKASKRKEMIKAKIHNFIHSAGLKWTITAAVLAFIFYVVPAYMWSYRNFNKIPGLDRVYKLVANNVYRPILDKEYAYDDWTHLKIDPNADIGVDRITKEDASELTRDYFKNTTLLQLGLSRQEAREAGEEVDASLNFESERFSADNMDAHFFYVMFKDTATAKGFTDRIVNAFNKVSDTAAKTKIRDTTYLYRSANFVAIGMSTHGIRRGHVGNKFKLKETPESLITF